MKYGQKSLIKSLKSKQKIEKSIRINVKNGSYSNLTQPVLCWVKDRGVTSANCVGEFCHELETRGEEPIEPLIIFKLNNLMFIK